MRQQECLAVLDSPIYSPGDMAKPRTADKASPSDFAVKLGNKLRHLREDVRHMSPQDVAAEVVRRGGSVSSSYIYRVEKGLNSPTAEMLSIILDALGSNLGLFFEDLITTESGDLAAEDRRCHRILQRGLDKNHAGTVAVINMLEQTL